MSIPTLKSPVEQELEKLKELCGYREDIVRKLEKCCLRLYEVGEIVGIHPLMILDIAYILLKQNPEIEIKVEHYVGSGKKRVRTDVYAEIGNKTAIYEIETFNSCFAFIEIGKTPDGRRIFYELLPQEVIEIRLGSKAARYSRYADKFSFVIPSSKKMEILKSKAIKFLQTPLEKRKKKDCRELLRLINLVYRNPPVSFDELMGAKLDGLIFLDLKTLAYEAIGEPFL